MKMMLEDSDTKFSQSTQSMYKHIDAKSDLYQLHALFPFPIPHVTWADRHTGQLV